jgi:hypothetical protein
MPSYRVHRLKDHLRQPFRFAPHVAGAASVKPRDYEPGVTITAPSPYAAYFSLRDSAAPLEVGDLLESENAGLWICKFIGFDEANWMLPEPRAEEKLETTPAVVAALE